MKPVIALAAAALLAGCVQPAYLPLQPIELQPYPPPIPYQTGPAYRPPLPPPAASVYPEPGPLAQPQAPDTAPSASDDNGPIPLQQMPPPAPDPAPAASTSPTVVQPAPVAQRPSTSGPGSNIPLEGFRPMRGQTRPAP